MAENCCVASNAVENHYCIVWLSLVQHRMIFCRRTSEILYAFGISFRTKRKLVGNARGIATIKIKYTPNTHTYEIANLTRTADGQMNIFQHFLCVFVIFLFMRCTVWHTLISFAQCPLPSAHSSAVKKLHIKLFGRVVGVCAFSFSFI